jgi:hypothetical protein
MHCTASAEAIAALGEQEEGDAAKEGTEAHNELEACLKGEQDGSDNYGVSLFLDYFRQLAPGRRFIEHRVMLTPQIWGRLDSGDWNEESATVTIGDLKNGFVGVDAEENEQLRIYAAALIMQHKLPARWIRYAIVQPNDFRPVPRVKQWMESADSLHAFATKAAAIPQGPKSFVAGEHCRYCPLFGRCQASSDLIAQLATVLQHAPGEVRPDQVATFKALEKPIADFFKAIDKISTKRALEGTTIAGMKLVTAQKNRAWTNEAAARAAVVEKLGVGVLKLPTPAQAEAEGMDVSGLADRTDGAPVLAFESDKRSDWKVRSVTEMFSNVKG